MSGPTPGDWAIEEPMDAEFWIVEAGKATHEWRIIATLPWPDEPGDIPMAQVRANAALIVGAKALLALAHQYRNDMLYPPADDSRERRIAAIDAVLKKIGGE